MTYECFTCDRPATHVDADGLRLCEFHLKHAGDQIGDRARDADESCPHGINVYAYCPRCSTPCPCHGHPYFDCPNGPRGAS